MTMSCICCMENVLVKSPAVLMPFVAHRVFGHKPLEILPEWGLRDLQAGMAYSLCNSVQCRNCGALFLDYRFDDKQMSALYAGYRDERYVRERDSYEPGYALRNQAEFSCRSPHIHAVEQWLTGFLPEKPLVLDWGGGDGLNTPFVDRGDAYVYDISGVPLQNGVGRIELDRIEQKNFDLIVCIQVLEHIPRPFDFLRSVCSMLSRDALLYLEVPHEKLMRDFPGSMDLAAQKHHWHEHVNFFTRNSLEHLLTRLGLCVVDFRAIPVNSGAGEVFGVLARIK